MSPRWPLPGRAALVPGALGLVLAAAGCGETFTASNGQGAGTTVSTGGGGTAGSGGQGGGSAGSGGEGGALACLGGNGCLACLAGADCKGKAKACSEDPACVELACCARSCNAGAEDCVDSCVSGSSNGFASAYLLAGCAFDHCEEQCALTKDLSPCLTCTLQKCAEDANACRADEQCTIYYDCLQQCDGEDCNCNSGVGGDAKDAAEKLDECRSTQCIPGRDPTCALP